MRPVTLNNVLTLSLAAAQLAASAAVKGPAIQARGESPSFPFDPETTADCTLWYDTVGASTCLKLLEVNAIPIADFVKWNPSITLECGNFKTVGKSYCIKVSIPESTSGVASQTSTAIPTATTIPTTSAIPATSAIPTTGATPTTTTTTPPTTTTSLPGNGITTPTPFQEGMSTSCNRFHMVKLNEQCGTIATEAGISLADLYLWNPAVGSKCTALWAENYVCIGVIGSTPTQPAGNGVATPSPIQPLMTNHCNKFQLIKAGDQCSSVASNAGISLVELYDWNPSIGRSCTSLWADTYVCIGLLGCTVSTSVSGRTCGRIGIPIAATGSGEISKHTNGPFVQSVENCSGNCLGTPGCTGFHFTAGSYCSLRYGPVSFMPNGNPGSSAYFEAACATSCPSTVPVVNTCSVTSPPPEGKHCGRIGVPVFTQGMGNLIAYNENSAYVLSPGTCAALCLDTPGCSSFYFTQSSRCSLFYGPISFSPNGNAGSQPFYEAECFACPSTTSCTAMSPLPVNTNCGRIGVPIASSGSETLIDFTVAPYVTSVGVCAAQCEKYTACTGFFFVEGSMCSLQYGPVSFNPNGNPGSRAFWDERCFATC
ncbi:hypothetical protein V499_02829 [Pseudogymnoascus sp. VKM F-103]|nr:hypothetical protein V499_02829 [Pseudogymnoascus sp. VKM F-103]